MGGMGGEELESDVMKCLGPTQGKEDELRDMEGKVRAHKARNRILEKSLAELQSKIQVLVEKTKTDDELIEALTAELKKSRVG